MVKDEIVGALASTFPEAMLEWRDDGSLHVDLPIHIDAPTLDTPENSSKRTREIVLRFEQGDIERLATMSPLERAQSMERLDKHVETAMTGYDAGRFVPPEVTLEPFVIRCDDFLVD
jgi:hypothetical protein